MRQAVDRLYSTSRARSDGASVPPAAAGDEHGVVAPERLTPLDSSFLRIETRSAHMHVGWRGSFRPDPARPAVTVSAVRELVAGRLPHERRFRQRVVFPPAGLGEPVWIDDERFDLRYHVRPLSGPGEAITRARFAELDRRLPVEAAGPRSTAVADRAGAPPARWHRWNGDEDPPRDGGRQVRRGAGAAAARCRSQPAGAGGRRALAARRTADGRPACARRAARHGGGVVAHGRGPGARGRQPHPGRAAGRDAASSGAVRRGGSPAPGAVVVPERPDRAAATAVRPHRPVARAARDQAAFRRHAQRRRAGRRRRWPAPAGARRATRCRCR